MRKQDQSPSIPDAVAAGKILVHATSAKGVGVSVLTPRLELEQAIRDYAGRWRTKNSEFLPEFRAIGESLLEAISTAFDKGVDNLSDKEWQNLCDDIVIVLCLQISTGARFTDGPDAILFSLNIVIDPDHDNRDIVSRGGLDPALVEEFNLDPCLVSKLS